MGGLQRHVLVVTARKPRYSAKGRKSLSENKSGYFSSMQNVAMIVSTVFLIVMPRFRKYRKLSTDLIAISMLSILKMLNDVSNCFAVS